MLIQHRQDVFRLIRQHDHALLAGALAFAWRSPDDSGLPWGTALATALHDVVWVEEDRVPHLDPVSGEPYDFATLPAEPKKAFVEAGVGRLAAVDPALAELVRAHHRTLAEGTPVEPGSPLAWLRFFDNLSLFLCLTPPGTTSRPAWLSSPTLEPPEGGALTLRWRGPDMVTMGPCPFGDGFRAILPYRDVARRRYDGQEDLTLAWNDARSEAWTLHLTHEAASYR